MPTARSGLGTLACSAAVVVVIVARSRTAKTLKKPRNTQSAERAYQKPVSSQNWIGIHRGYRADCGGSSRDLVAPLHKKNTLCASYISSEHAQLLRAQVHDWKTFVANRTPEELCELYHGSIRRIDVDFEAGVALVHWTFTLTTSRIDLTREKARARERTRASKKLSIDEPVGRVSGQVVEPRGFEPMTSSVRGMRSPS